MLAQKHAIHTLTHNHTQAFNTCAVIHNNSNKLWKNLNKKHKTDKKKIHEKRRIYNDDNMKI